MIDRLERALEANRRLQARLVGILEAVDGAIWDNAQAQAALARNSVLHPRAGRYRGMRGALQTELLRLHRINREKEGPELGEKMNVDPGS